MASAERLVLDTNVVLSALLFPGSLPNRALLRAQASQTLASDATLLELVEVMGRARFDRYVERDLRQKLAAEYMNACEVVRISLSHPRLPRTPGTTSSSKWPSMGGPI